MILDVRKLEYNQTPNYSNYLSWIQALGNRTESSVSKVSYL